MKHSYERIHNDITHIFSFTFTKKIYCYLSSSFYTWPRPTSSMKPPRLSWSNYGRGDLSRTGRKRKIGIPHYTHINHQIPSILKIKTCTKNKWTNYIVIMSKCISTKIVKCMTFESCLLMLRYGSIWYIVKLQWCFKFHFSIAINLTANSVMR